MLFALLHWFVSALAMMATAYLVRGFKVRSFGSALFACVVIALADMLVRPLLFFLTLPLNILTLGLFTFVLNGIMIRICAALVPGFEVDGWASAIFGALVLAIIGTGLHFILI